MTSVTTLSPHKTTFAKPSSPFIESFTEPDNGRGMREEKARLETFIGWPCTFISPRTLAKAGFYYTTKEDIVKCAFCRVEIGKWDEQDEPLSEHQKWAPNCSFIRDVSGLSNKESITGNSMTIQSGEDTCGKYGVERRPMEPMDNEGAGCSNTNGLRAECQKLGIQTYKAPVHPDFVLKEKRLKSFNEWPRSMKQKPVDLAAAGFFYTGRGDQTLCFQCGGGLKDWEDEDDPWEQHALWFPKCNYLELQKSRDFILEVAEKKKKAAVPEAPVASLQSEEKNEAKSGSDAKTDVKKLENGDSESCNGSMSAVCKICYAKDVGVVFLPCGHLVACVDCAPALSKCAVCRKPLTGTVRTFLT